MESFEGEMNEFTSGRAVCNAKGVFTSSERSGNSTIWLRGEAFSTSIGIAESGQVVEIRGISWPRYIAVCMFVVAISGKLFVESEKAGSAMVNFNDC